MKPSWKAIIPRPQNIWQVLIDVANTLGDDITVLR